MCVSHPVYPARNSSSGPAAGWGGGREGAQTSPCHLSPPPGAGTWGAMGSVPPRAASPANIFNIRPFPLHLFLILGLERHFSPKRLAFLSEMPCTSTSPSPTRSFSACFPSQNVAEAEGFSWETELRRNLVFSRKSFHGRL